MHSYGTIHQLTCLGTSQQNGKAERKLYHILDTVCALLLFAKVSAPFQGEAAIHIVHAINHIRSPIIQNQTPYERLFRSPPNYYHLHSFSSACFILLQPNKHNKLKPRLRLCCFLSYGETQKGYRCYDPVSHRLPISHNIVFWEHRSFVKLSHFHASLSSSSILDLLPDKTHIPSIAAPNPPIVAPNFPIDFSIQPPDIFDPLPSSPFNEQVKDQLPNPKLGSPALIPPKDLAQDIPPRHSTWVKFIPAYLLDYHCYTALATVHEPHTYHEASINPL